MVRIVLVTGARGLLGRALVAAAPPGVDARATTRAGFDIAEEAPLDRYGPLTGVLHAAGWSRVDAAEADPAGARRDNETATRVLAEACAERGVPLLVVGTDFVFDGRGDLPCREDDPPAPLQVYGETKLAAERAALEAWPKGTRVVRTQWLYGPEGTGHFVARVLARARAGEKLRVVDDQVGCPTSTTALAPALWDALLHAPPGIYHAACEGCCSRFELARAVLEEAGLDPARVAPCASDAFPGAAPRPAFAPLDCSKLATVRGRRLPHWREALIRYVAGHRPGGRTP